MNREPAEPVTAAAMALRLLGAPAWRALDQADWRPLAAKDALLLAALALDGPQARAALAARLWPGVGAARAQANLRQRLFRLRRTDAALVCEQGDRLALEPLVQCDVLHGDGFAPGGLAAPLLEGIGHAAMDTGDDDATQWLEQARLAWAARRPERWLAAVTRREAAGDLSGALELLHALLACEPLYEHAWRQLMQLHLARNDRAAALATFERCEQVLRDELGVQPSPPTLALLHRAESQSAAAPPADPGWPPALRRPLPFTGREAERRAMAAAWADGRAFVLVGQAGMGKSRLLGVWAALHSGCAQTAARPGDGPVAYITLVRLLRAVARAAQRPEALWPEGPTRRELARLLPELGEPPASDGLQALLHDAVERTLERAPAAGVRALLLDDLQQADEATLALLPRLLALPGLAWGLATRPGLEPRLSDWLSSSARLARIDLAPLSAAALASLLAGLDLPPALAQTLGVGSADGGAARLAQHSGGNPLFVLETLRHLAVAPASEVLPGSSGASLPGRVPGVPPADASARASLGTSVGASPGASPSALPGTAHLRPDAQPDPLPLAATVQALLTQRLSTLPPGALALAQVAAVAAEDFDADVAAQLLGCSLLDLAAPWQALEQAQVLSGLRFAHDALREAVLATLPTALRGPIHAGVGRSLATRGTAPARAAMHLAAGECWSEVGAAQLQAAEAARRLGRHAQRLASLEAAAEAFDRVGDSEAAFQARLAAVASRHAGEGLPAARAALDALASAAQLHPGRSVPWRLEAAELALAAYDQARLLQETQALAELAPASAEARRLLRGLQACAAARAGDSAAAEQLLGGLAAQLETEAPAASLLPSWNHVAVLRHHLGHSRPMAQALAHQRDLAATLGHAEREADALLSLAGLHTQLGDAERALSDGRAAVALQRRLGAEHLARMGELNLLIALIGCTALAEALALSGELATHFVATAAGSDLPHIVADLRADLWLRLGQPARALAELEGPALHDLVPARQLNRLGLRWRAQQAMGDGAAATASMTALRERLTPPAQMPVRSGGVWVRSAALFAWHLGPGVQAAAWLQHAEAAARHAELPGAQALAAWVALRLARQAGQLAEVRVRTQQLQALRPQARHLYLDEAELLAEVASGLDESASPTEAAAWRNAAQAWAEEQLLHNLPPAWATRWRARPALQAIWSVHRA